MRRAGYVSLALAVVAFFAAAPGWAEEPVPEEPKPGVMQEYEAGTDAVRSAVIAEFAEHKLVLESSPELSEGEILSDYLAFTRDDFGPDVAEPPPELSLRPVVGGSNSSSRPR